MECRHSFSPLRVGRSGFALALLWCAGFGGVSGVRAQDVALPVSPISAIEVPDDAGLRAYIATLPSAPTPNVEPAAPTILQGQSPTQGPTEQGHAFFWLDRRSLTCGLVQGSAEIFDGVTTRYFLHHCSLCFENDPMSRLLLGTHPSWGKMIPMGVAEAGVSAYSYRRLSRSPNRFLRAAAPLVPMGLTAVHVIEGARNVTLKNKYRCADPGYVVVGAVCVPGPQPILTGAVGASGRGLGSDRNSL